MTKVVLDVMILLELYLIRHSTILYNSTADSMLRPSLALGMAPPARFLGSMDGRKRKRWIGRGRDGGGKKEVSGEWQKRRTRGIVRVKEVGVVRGVKALRIARGERADREFRPRHTSLRTC